MLITKVTREIKREVTNICYLAREKFKINFHFEQQNVFFFLPIKKIKNKRNKIYRLGRKQILKKYFHNLSRPLHGLLSSIVNGR